jgi:methylated-DNA-protein-cysteine methyltransferase-like protein
MREKTFTERVIEIIKNIPPGQVATYGGIAEMAGNARAARQVVRVLHSSSRKRGLPWHRVINKQGRIALKDQGYERQKTLLEAEGIYLDLKGRIDLDEYLWKPVRGLI